MTKIGFAITAYDKFEEAEIGIEIIRKEFKKDYVIGFCSNHPDAKKISKDWDINTFIAARNISFNKPKGTESTHTTNEVDRFSIQVRALDSVRTSCKQLLDYDIDYITHVHSDAWYLNENMIHTLTEEMEKRKNLL